MAEKKKLGDMLKEAGVIDDFQLQSALAHQKNWGGKLGGILVEMGFAREEDIARAIAQNLRIPYVDLFEPPVADNIIKMIKPDIARKYSVMPAKKEGGALVLVMSDPMDIEAMDAIRFATGLTIKPALAMESEVRDAIRKYYDGENVVRVRQEAPSFAKTTRPAEKMEIIRGSELGFQKEEQAPILSKEETTRQEQTDVRLRLEALISLLIEKQLINREELVSMVYQKKMGL